jgi:hypothetical protein
MQKRMSAELIGQIVNHARKITLFRATPGLRPYLEILPIFNKIREQLHAWLLSKNGMRTQKPCLTVPCLHVNQSLPTT